MDTKRNEFELIRRLSARIRTPLPPGAVGIGDDAAAVPDGDGWLLLTCDIALEGRHFRIGEMPWADLGWRVATANVSDIAACGGTPGHALVSLGVPDHVSEADLEALYDGLDEAARTYGFAVLGGNVSGAAELIVDLFLTGHTARFVSREGARPGDLLAVSGPLGDGAAGQALLAEGAADEGRVLVQRHLRPRARTDLAGVLRDAASAAIDISDGLSSDLAHLAAASGVRLELEAAALPRSPELEAHARRTGRDVLEWVLHGGECYELAIAYPPERAAAFEGRGLTVIGSVVAGEGVFLDGAPLAPGGWNHLAR